MAAPWTTNTLRTAGSDADLGGRAAEERGVARVLAVADGAPADVPGEPAAPDRDERRAATPPACVRVRGPADQRADQRDQDERQAPRDVDDADPVRPPAPTGSSRPSAIATAASAQAGDAAGQSVSCHGQSLRKVSWLTSR